MAIVPNWWAEYKANFPDSGDVIRDASGQLVVFDVDTPSGVNPIQDLYVANNFALPSQFLAQVANIPATGNTTGLPASPVNTIASAFGLVIPGDPAGGVLNRVLEFAAAIYGSTEMGQIKTSSGYLYADPTSGIRPGLIELPRIVAPPGAYQGNRR